MDNIPLGYRRVQPDEVIEFGDIVYNPGGGCYHEYVAAFGWVRVSNSVGYTPNFAWPRFIFAREVVGPEPIFNKRILTVRAIRRLVRV
jgi:hypothetical protein